MANGGVGAAAGRQASDDRIHRSQHVVGCVTRRAAFAKRLGELGWIEGRNLTIEYRWAEGVVPRAGEIAAEYARQNVDVIVVSGDAQVLREVGCGKLSPSELQQRDSRKILRSLLRANRFSMVELRGSRGKRRT